MVMFVALSGMMLGALSLMASATDQMLKSGLWGRGWGSPPSDEN